MRNYKQIAEDQFTLIGDETADNTAYYHPAEDDRPAKLIWGFNIAPDEDENMHLKHEAINYLDKQIRYLQTIQKLLKNLKEKVFIDQDFYWHDGDLNLHIEVSIDDNEIEWLNDEKVD